MHAPARHETTHCRRNKVASGLVCLLWIGVGLQQQRMTAAEITNACRHRLGYPSSSLVNSSNVTADILLAFVTSRTVLIKTSSPASAIAVGASCFCCCTKTLELMNTPSAFTCVAYQTMRAPAVSIVHSRGIHGTALQQAHAHCRRVGASSPPHCGAGCFLCCCCCCWGCWDVIAE